MEKNPGVEMVKNVISFCALIWSIAMITGLQFSSQTGLAADVHPALAFVCLWGATIWLSFVEGGQASLVGLAPINRELYKESHPIAYKCSIMSHVGDALDRYLLGRQFMVVFIVFTINISGGPVADAELWGLPDVIISIFMGSGLAMILFTTMVGQLNSQVNASHCMLDYLNSTANYFTICVAMAVEFSGLVHSSYIIQILVAAAAGQEIESNEAPKSPIQNLFFFSRCIMSLGILIFAFAVTLTALFQGKTTMWESVPPGIAVILFFVLMAVVGMLEGMQIAFFAVAKLRPEDRGNSKFAKMTCEVLFYGDGFNLSGFMIGRQLSVVSCMFFIARVTSLNIDPDAGEPTLWGVSAATQRFFNMGFLGALITTIVASIAWQLVASAFPIAFLSNPFTYILLRFALFLEGTGLCNGAYVIAMAHKKCAGFQRDEVYIGTAEERAANQTTADDYSNLHVGCGHLVKLPGFSEFVDMLESAPPALRALAKKDASVFSYLAESAKLAENTDMELTENDEKLKSSRPASNQRPRDDDVDEEMDV
jgi:silicon transporter